jgi:hypothetical protein
MRGYAMQKTSIALYQRRRSFAGLFGAALSLFSIADFGFAAAGLMPHSLSVPVLKVSETDNLHAREMLTANASEKPSDGREGKEAGEQQFPQCTSDQQCPTGSSCWYQMPRGPYAGIRGSIEKPGTCVPDDVIRQIY